MPTNYAAITAITTQCSILHLVQSGAQCKCFHAQCQRCVNSKCTCAHLHTPGHVGLQMRCFFFCFFFTNTVNRNQNMLFLCHQWRTFPDSLHAVLWVEFEKNYCCWCHQSCLPSLTEIYCLCSLILETEYWTQFSAALILCNVHYTNKAYETGIFVTYKSSPVKL